MIIMGIIAMKSCLTPTMSLTTPCQLYNRKVEMTLFKDKDLDQHQHENISVAFIADSIASGLVMRETITEIKRALQEFGTGGSDRPAGNHPRVEPDCRHRMPQRGQGARTHL